MLFTKIWRKRDAIRLPKKILPDMNGLWPIWTFFGEMQIIYWYLSQTQVLYLYTEFISSKNVHILIETKKLHSIVVHVFNIVKIYLYTWM